MNRKLAQNHVDRLIRAHNLTLVQDRPAEQAKIILETRTVYGPKLRTVTDYLTTLHEIGHIVSTQSLGWGTRHARSRGRRRTHDRFMSEAAAWAWAYQHASPTILKQASERDYGRLGSLLMSYGFAPVS